MKLLSKTEHLATMEEPMKRLPSDSFAPFSFWDYFDAIPPADFQGHDCSEGVVRDAWETFADKYQHVLVDSEDKNVFMVIVLDLVNSTVLGHFLLDLNREYGLKRALN
jgi:hypothetical protein